MNSDFLATSNYYVPADLENIFCFMTAKSKNKTSCIVDFRERMVLHMR